MTGRRVAASRGFLVLLVVLQGLLGGLLASLYLSASNSLYNNGNWVSTKTTLAEGVLGAFSFVFDLQPLAGGHLDLGAWHGYQELVSRGTFDPRRIEFEFAFTGGSYLVFEFNRTDDRFTGIRLSTSPLYPSALLVATPAGEFLEKVPFQRLWRVQAQKLHRLAVELEDDRFVVFLDGRRLKRVLGPVARPQRIGFRSGQNPAYIDNVTVVERDGAVFHDSFARRANWLPVTVAAIALSVALALAAFFWLARRRPDGGRRLSFFFLMFSGMLVVLAAIVLAFANYQSRLYPDEGKYLRLQEEYWKGNETERIFDEIRARYPKSPPPGRHRIVFLGSSQTRGSGAARADETLVRQTETLLNRAAGGRRFECVNTAIHGYSTSEMEATFRERWLEWGPATVVVNAANNDMGYGLEAFERNLGAIAELARERRIRLVLVMEPNSVERGEIGLAAYHEAMARVGRSAGALVVDMHGHLEERYDDGFLWWDWVHLTSYGQRLFAEHLVAEMAAAGVVDLGPAP